MFSLLEGYVQEELEGLAPCRSFVFSLYSGDGRMVFVHIPQDLPSPGLLSVLLLVVGRNGYCIPGNDPNLSSFGGQTKADNPRRVSLPFHSISPRDCMADC